MSYEKPDEGAASYPAYANPPVYANPPMYANPPTYATPVMGSYVTQGALDANTVKDYLVWSIISIFCGWGILGFIPLTFSLLCRNNKAVNNYSGARSMSTFALVSNIIITIVGSIAWLTFIIIMAMFLTAAHRVYPG
jgi:hypothetical protein